MTAKSNAHPEVRALKFFPFGVDNPRNLNRKQIEDYNEKGYLFQLDMFGKDEIVEIRAYFDELLPKTLTTGWKNYELTNWHNHKENYFTTGLL